MRSRFAAALLLVAAAAAQAQPAARAPVEVGRTFASGGTSRRILVAADQRHALTIGSHGDLCWWDLERREVLRHVAPRERYVSAVALHPTRALAAVCWTKGSHGDDAPVSAVDLETGDVTQWLPGRFDALQFDASGRQLAVQRAVDETVARELLRFDVDALPAIDLEAATQRQRDATFHHGLRFVDGRVEGDGTATYAQPTAARSPDGEHAAAIVKSTKSDGGLQLDGKTFTPPCPETWLTHLRVTDAGLVIAADIQGQLHFVTADGAMQLRAPHRGDALRLVFSPDSHHVAVLGLGAVRIVALDGTQELELQGSHIVVPGDVGGEFRIFARHRSWRFDAATRREVGETMSWQEPSMPMLHWLPGRGWHDPKRGGLTSQHRIADACMIEGAPWFAGDDSRTNLYRWQGSDWLKTATGSPFVSASLLLSPGNHGVVLVTCSSDLSDDSSSGAVNSFDLEGQQKWRWQSHSDFEWAVSAPGHRCLWLGAGSQVLRLDLVERSVVAHQPERDWLAADLLPDGSPFGSGLLASDGAGLLVFDRDWFEERRRWPNPDGWKSIDVIAVAPDGRHVAIAHRDDVRILRLP
ncbi:MAG: hypothetical protein H6835_01265 [Planctomycetes bacterium]|nr:hypothetical protein [Planctomycetota bacterium]